VLRIEDKVVESSDLISALFESIFELFDVPHLAYRQSTQGA
jgi:hypothetical protein